MGIVQRTRRARACPRLFQKTPPGQAVQFSDKYKKYFVRCQVARTVLFVLQCSAARARQPARPLSVFFLFSVLVAESCLVLPHDGATVHRKVFGFQYCRVHTLLRMRVLRKASLSSFSRPFACQGRQFFP